jgi:hypothetical protein
MAYIRTGVIFPQGKRIFILAGIRDRDDAGDSRRLFLFTYGKVLIFVAKTS